MSAKVLVVEDDAITRDGLVKSLELEDFTALRAGSGREALEVFERDRPDLVLLDVNLGDMSGMAVLARIRAREQDLGATQRTPVIVVTGFAERDLHLAGAESGADEFLAKPVDLAIMFARIRTLLQVKEMAASLAARNAELLRLQDHERELIQLIVHDMRSPLTIIGSNLEWAEGQLSGARPEVAGAIADAHDAARRLRAMIDEMLTVAVLEQPRLALRRQPVVAGEIVADVVKGNRRLAAERDLALAAEVEDGLGVDADPVVIRRVLENLMENALRYTPKGGRIEVSAHRATGVELAVANTGVAIPAQERARIFDKFQRVERADGGAGKAGLGLYFCKCAVEAHGGSIRVEETPAWPTAFVISLPA